MHKGERDIKVWQRRKHQSDIESNALERHRDEHIRERQRGRHKRETEREVSREK